MDEIPFPLPKSRETKDAVVFNGFHLIGQSRIDSRLMYLLYVLVIFIILGAINIFECEKIGELRISREFLE